MNVADSRSDGRPLFYTVAEAARVLRVSEMTLYRAVEAHEFPAVRVRTRIVIPAAAVERMVAAALESNGPVDAAAWATKGIA